MSELYLSNHYPPAHRFIVDELVKARVSPAIAARAVALEMQKHSLIYEVDCFKTWHRFIESSERQNED